MDIIIQPTTGESHILIQEIQGGSLLVAIGTYDRKNNYFDADYHVCEIAPGKSVQVFAAQHCEVAVSHD